MRLRDLGKGRSTEPGIAVRKSNVKNAERGTYVAETMKQGDIMVVKPDEVSRANVREVVGAMGYDPDKNQDDSDVFTEPEIRVEMEQQTITTKLISEVPAKIQGELMPYTRVVDLLPGLELIPLDQLSGHDLILWRYDKWHSAENDADFITMEVSILDNPERRFLTNCGGQDAMKKVMDAFQMIEEKKANPPLVANFIKVPTGNGRTFWVVR